MYTRSEDSDSRQEENKDEYCCYAEISPQYGYHRCGHKDSPQQKITELDKLTGPLTGKLILKDEHQDDQSQHQIERQKGLHGLRFHLHRSECDQRRHQGNENAEYQMGFRVEPGIQNLIDPHGTIYGLRPILPAWIAHIQTRCHGTYDVFYLSLALISTIHQGMLI